PGEEVEQFPVRPPVLKVEESTSCPRPDPDERLVRQIMLRRAGGSCILRRSGARERIERGRSQRTSAVARRGIHRSLPTPPVSSSKPRSADHHRRRPKSLASVIPCCRCCASRAGRAARGG